MKKAFKVFAVVASLGILGTLQLDITNVEPVNSSAVQAATNNGVTQNKSKMKSALANMKGKYDNAPKGRPYGKFLPKEDLMVVGISRGASFADIQQSLGKPTAIEYSGGYIVSVAYGGIYFYPFLHSEEIQTIEITNRDATTARGVAVGDSLEKVYSLYGRPDLVQENKWFYGVFKYYTDYIVGIRFIHDDNVVTRIVIL
ncbi:hypothetical protein [Veillonella criceti]|uniref:Uncharacterized protein n=1 Tax=Veillonella criceti TaxID=103891 RepID=A0A380NIS8_9FIRM|nr:hypothetical protein [Veillonella criceti]SUP41544.1 Uncharacterised protein [Veillonella criceti]